MLWSQRCNVSCKQYRMLFGWCYVWWDAREAQDKLRWSSHRKTVGFGGENRGLSHFSWGHCSVSSLSVSQSQRLCCWTSLNCKDVFCISVMMVDTQWVGVLLVSVNLTPTGVPWEEGASLVSFRSVRHIYLALSWGIMDVEEPSLMWIEPPLGRWSGRFKKGSLNASQ